MTQTSKQPGTTEEISLDDFHPIYCQIAWPKEAVSPESGKTSYSAALIVKKGSPDYAKLVGLYKAGVKTYLAGKAPNPAPLKDGDLTNEDGEFVRAEDAFRDAVYVNVRTQFKPKIKDRAGNELQFADVQSGDHYGAMINLYSWNYQGKKGISFGLGQMVFVSAGKKIGGNNDATDKLAALFTRPDIADTSSDDIEF